MGQQRAEGLAVGLIPGKHAGEHAATLRAESIACRAMVGIVHSLVPIGIEGSVKVGDFLTTEEVFNLQKALQVKEKLFSVIH